MPDFDQQQFWNLVFNGLDVTTFLAYALFLCIVFHKELFGQDPSTFVMLLTGLSIDRLIGRTLKPLKNRVK